MRWLTRKQENALNARLDNLWPNCPIADCPNKICLSLNSDKCWPHTVGVPLDWAKGLGTAMREEQSRIIEEAYLARKRGAHAL